MIEYWIKDIQLNLIREQMGPNNEHCVSLKEKSPCTYMYKDANLHVKKMKMLLGPKLINGQSRTQPVQPNNM